MTDWDFVRHLHRLLTKAGVPGGPVVPRDDMDEENNALLVARLKSLGQYIGSVRWKWLRAKKKAAAANRELADYRKGNKKTWETRAKALEQEMTDAITIFLTKHAVKVHGMYQEPRYLRNLIEYLTDRSNQLYANDSAVERRAIADVKEARLAKAEMEKTVLTYQRRLQWYVTRYGRPTDLGDVPTESFSDAMKQADSFPWKRGNPGYLGDYTIEQLINEVERRADDLCERAAIARGITMEHADAKKV
jgi:sulfur relay (sulfurtransferase) complex TusBCD TusD component (DsrE family)